MLYIIIEKEMWAYPKECS